MFLNLGLGRMGCLVGALGISAALDLNFASGTFPPQVTHSRSSSATQVYSDGLVDFAPENLLLYSRTLSNGAWTGSNRSISDDTTADPPNTTNGTTADTIVEDTSVGAFHWIAQAVTKPAVAEKYLFTGYCHSSSARDIAVYLQNGANGCNARFRPSTGVNTGPAATFGSGWSSVSSSITSIGGGWHRFALQATSDGTTSITAQIALYNAAFSYTGDGVSGATVYGLRLQRGTHSRAEDDFLLQTTSAAVYGPHITYDPSSLACLGYLNEPQRTNLWPSSATFPTTGVATTTAAAGTAPSGATVATRITAAGVSWGGLWRGSSVVASNPTFAAATTYTLSLFAKADTASRIGVRLGGDMKTAGDAYCWWDLSTGAATQITPTAGTVVAIGSTNHGNGWWRVTVTYTNGATPSGLFDIAIVNASGGTNYTPAGTESVLVWGLQIEAASTASSYIPTAGASATRAADVAYVDVATWLPALSMTNATFYAETLAAEAGNQERILSTNSATDALIASASNALIVQAYDGTSNPTIIGSTLVGAERKSAISLTSGAFTLAYQGATTTAATNTFSAPTRIYIGSLAGSSNFFAGTIPSARVYYGAQSAGQIATLTT